MMKKKKKKIFFKFLLTSLPKLFQNAKDEILVSYNPTG